MKVSDLVFSYAAGIAPQSRGICRIRVFVSSSGRVVLITDLGRKNTGPSVTNSIENIIAALYNEGVVVGAATFIEHYEAGARGPASYDVVTLSPSGEPIWERLPEIEVMALAACNDAELADSSKANLRLVEAIDRVRNSIDPFIDSPLPEDPSIINRRGDIAANMVSKKRLSSLVASGTMERSFQALLKSDLSLFGELYGDPHEEYICFSEFPLADGVCDFAVFTGRSRMDVVLIEIKGADFYLVNRDSYMGFARRINQAADQIRRRLGYVYRHYQQFRAMVHRIRRSAESGRLLHNAFLGPYWRLEVDPKKDVHIRAVVIGGRTRNDLDESVQRHDYETRFSPPIKIESWDTLLRKLRRA